MAGQFLISVVIPTYNRAHLIEAAIESVFAQKYPKLEIIVVDDGSVDGTADTVQTLIKRVGSNSRKRPEIRYLYQPNMGQSRARNAGIAAARGDWIAFLDSDDQWLPDKIEWQLRAIERFGNECGACVADSRLVNKSDNLDITAFQWVGKRYKELMGIVPNATADLAKSLDGFWVQALLVRSDLAKQIRGFDNDLHFV